MHQPAGELIHNYDFGVSVFVVKDVSVSEEHIVATAFVGDLGFYCLLDVMDEFE